MRSSEPNRRCERSIGRQCRACLEHAWCIAECWGFRRSRLSSQILPHVMVNQQLVIFQQNAQLKNVVPIAVDRAIREIIQPVVERSVTIACITTKELIVKDFAMESNEQKMRKAAQLMVGNLAGSLAVVTCKEPLRISMANNLRTLLQKQPGLDSAALEQAVQTCSAENLELGCMLIEKASTEAAARDIEEALSAPLAERRKAAAQGQAYTDEKFAGSRYPAALPEMLRPTRQGLGPQQLMVYEAFTRQSPMATVGAAQGGGVAAGVGSNVSNAASGGAAADGQQAPPPPPPQQQQPRGPGDFIAGSQGLTIYGPVAAMENSIVNLIAKNPGRQLSLGMLGPDHEISVLVRQTLEVTQKIAPSERDNTAFLRIFHLLQARARSRRTASNGSFWWDPWGFAGRVQAFEQRDTKLDKLSGDRRRCK